MEKKTVKRVMGNRGRPRKSQTDNSPVRKPRALRLTEEEVKFITEKAQRCKMNFSEYSRKVLMNYKPTVPDPEFRNGLFAARKDIVNFINAIRGLNMDKEERKRFLLSMPVLKEWWKKLFPMIEFIDKQMERI
jgi:hypothetical protein